mmetsp:Transcript_7346/g.30422  ORF Transcript_7346/g.30422 Transcript_7346/m.30422 type:complete len:102 (-) Transcript_7346:326-631(-)
MVPNDAALAATADAGRVLTSCSTKKCDCSRSTNLAIAFLFCFVVVSAASLVVISMLVRRLKAEMAKPHDGAGHVTEARSVFVPSPQQVEESGVEPIVATSR